MSLFEVGNYVIIDDIYIGKIVKKIWNGYGMIVKLDNDPTYVDNTILQYHLINDITNNLDIKGFMLVKSTNKMRLVNKHNLSNLIKLELSKEKFMYINTKINKNLTFYKTHILPTIQTNIMSSVPLIPTKSIGEEIKTEPIPTIEQSVSIGSLFSSSLGFTGGGTKISEQLNKIKSYIKTANLIDENYSNKININQLQTTNIVGGVYNPYINNIIGNSSYQNIPQLINTSNISSDQLGTSKSTDTEHISVPPDNKKLIFKINENKYKLDEIDGVINDNIDDNTDVKKDKLQKFREQDKTEDNYELYIKNMINNLFRGEDEIDHEETFNDGKLYAGLAEEYDLIRDGEKDEKIKPTIKMVLEQFKKINKSLYLDLTNTLLYKHIISDNKMDNVSFGKELILRIKECLTNIQKKIKFEDNRPTSDFINLFGYLKFKIAGGYIIIEDVNNENKKLRKITQELVPDLKILAEHYDNSINYKVLSNIILENKTTMDLQKNKDIVLESLNILAQEYVICLQSRVEYLLWTLTRLILCWYADPVLNENIVKIKVLINLYRARGIKDFNKEIGVQPVIIIVPKYGRSSALKILSYLSYYLFPYKNVGWKGSSPSYFNKVDDLIYYTNGSIDLKRYIKHLLKTGNKIISPISGDFTKIDLPDNSNEVEYRLPINK